jgi:hypothetical protein
MNYKGIKGKWIIENLHAPLEGKYPADEIDISSDIDECFCTIWSVRSVSSEFDKQAKSTALLISKSFEMLKMLNDIKEYLGSDVRENVDILIKEATEF